MKVEILEFSGGLHAEEFVDWLNTMESIFQQKEDPENKEAKLVAIRLKDKTLLQSGFLYTTKKLVAIRFSLAL